ncbi:glycoside hydrolase family 31 protein [Streptomyces sp. PTM05]|uniref:Glycoside hydrolase family 31 protein n=1 Tax=Streptantibioticus parmotrematis TaxID=2873249 RepID=A0ABS7QR62_9ACTN|nr:glycoside hydrolase family 31 protein [Streptantibioticus parmotrematis]MBY8885681.1 glycoside hydrolase family 31 protein [Streptantibioticus parmotrematis]
MDTRDLARQMRFVGSAGGWRALWAGWRRYRTDGRDLPRRGAERARVPGVALGAEPAPGGGVVRFARSALRIRVAMGGAVFCGWDGAEPEPSYALAGGCPEADERAVLEPDLKTDGWRVVSERITVVVSRHGGVEFRTPGGVLLRAESPPRWWDAPPGPARWVQRSRTPADAEVFGLGGRAAGPRLPQGAYRLWNTDPGGAFGPGDDPLYVTMPVQLVVADAGCHLVFHDNTWDGRVTLSAGVEGAGSGHDRPGGCEVRFEGGPLRYWVMTGPPGRVLRTWTALTGRPALPPRWALGYQHARWGFGSEREVRRVVAGYRERGLPLSAVHLDIDHLEGHRVFTVDERAFPDLPGLARELGEHGTRLVSIVDPAVKAEPGLAAYDSGTAADAFVRDARGRVVRGVVWPGEAVFPDFTDPRVRRWWGGWYAERLERGFAGVWHDMNEPTSFAAFGDPSLPRSARHAMEGRGGDHREAHNVYGLAMARAGFEALRELRPEQRPFLFSRAGWAGMQRYGGTWSGDVATGWPGLRASLSLVLGLGLCGVPYSGPDVGGFSALPSPELYVRWLQLAAYLPFFRTHSAIGAGPREPWEFGERALECARAALAERERLRPYLYTLAHVAHRTGAPYARPLWWHDPRDRALRGVGDAFLLGDALLVAPVLEQGATRRAVRLPRGRWYDTVTGVAYEGPGQVLLDAPLERIVVLARAGAVLPVAGADSAVELEVWAPAVGRTGGGVLIDDAGDGWQEPVTARFATRWHDGAVVVEREGEQEVGFPVRVRGVES